MAENSGLVAPGDEFGQETRDRGGVFGIDFTRVSG